MDCGDYSETVRKVPLSLVVGEGRRDPGEDGRVWAWGMGEPELALATLLTYLAPEVGVVREVNSMAVALRAARSTRNASGRRSVAWSGTVAVVVPRDRSRWML